MLHQAGAAYTTYLASKEPALTCSWQLTRVSGAHGRLGGWMLLHSVGLAQLNAPPRASMTLQRQRPFRASLGGLLVSSGAMTAF